MYLIIILFFGLNITSIGTSVNDDYGFGLPDYLIIIFVFKSVLINISQLTVLPFSRFREFRDNADYSRLTSLKTVLNSVFKPGNSVCQSENIIRFNQNNIFKNIRF